MHISRPLAFTWLPLLVLLTACSDGAAGSVPGSTGDTSTGESPGTPTSAGPSSSPRHENEDMIFIQLQHLLGAVNVTKLLQRQIAYCSARKLHTRPSLTLSSFIR